MRLPVRLLREIGTWVPIGGFAAAAWWFGFEQIAGIAFAILFLVIAVGYPLYLWTMKDLGPDRSTAVESGRLVQRMTSGRETGAIDLARPFDARYVRQDPEWVIYRVEQAGEGFQVAVRLDSDGSIVRDVLHLPWPPPACSPFRYL
jgi:hypothetical protein